MSVLRGLIPSLSACESDHTFHRAARLATQLATIAQRPRFTLAGVLTLMLCTGANTAVFNALEGWLLAPPPYPHSEQLVHLYNLSKDGRGRFLRDRDTSNA